MWSHVTDKVTCLQESDTHAVGFSVSCRIPLTLLWHFILIYCKPIIEASAVRHCSRPWRSCFTSMSNKGTMKLISLLRVYSVRTCTYVLGNYPVELLLFQRAPFPQQNDGRFRGVFSLNNRANISWLHHTSFEAQLTQKKRLSDPRPSVGTCQNKTQLLSRDWNISGKAQDIPDTCT